MIWVRTCLTNNEFPINGVKHKSKAAFAKNTIFGSIEQCQEQLETAMRGQKRAPATAWRAWLLGGGQAGSPGLDRAHTSEARLRHRGPLELR